MNNTTVITVSQLNFYIKSMFEENSVLSEIYISGEISNLTDHYRSGHIYLSLKDDKAALRAVMFAGNARRLKFKPEEGMRVIARGRVSVYEATGQYQLYIEDMQPDGVGAVNLAFEQLKKKLSAEGLFSSEYKKPIPKLPKRIGVITSPTGAAVRDIFQILNRRYPLAEVVFCPVLVQGDGAPTQLIDALNRFNKGSFADVIIIGRGGGSTEDLWAFNDEGLARAVFSSKIPIISAVGHETDFTICDFVADLRAPTPSAAAELATPNIDELILEVKNIRSFLPSTMTKRIDCEKQTVDKLSSSSVLSSPKKTLSTHQNELEITVSRLKSAFSEKIYAEHRTFEGLSARLDTLSPLAVLSRGYCTAYSGKKLIKSVDNIKPSDSVTVKFSDGSAECKVLDVKKAENKNTKEREKNEETDI